MFRPLLLASILLLVPGLRAQCGQGFDQLQNDSLPKQLGSLSTVAVVPGLCANEAAMSVFQVGGAVDVHEVGIVFAAKNGANNVLAAVDVELYDGATVDAKGRYTLGKRIFRLSDNNNNLQISSTALNTHKLKVPVTCSSGTLVVGFRMIQNLSNGSCTLGYTANFATDNQMKCVPGINVLDAINHGPVDPCTYTGFGAPLYPIYFRGSWIIRACVKPKVSTRWSGNATPGGFVSLEFLAPGQAGDGYFALVSGGTQKGFVTPWGTLPLDFDPVLACFLSDCRPMLAGGQGTFNAQDKAYGSLAIPNLATLKGLTLYAGFFSFQGQALLNWKTVSAPSPPIRIQ